MVEELRAMQRVCDGFGLSTAGAFATADPSVSGHLYSDTSTGTDEVQSLAAIDATSGNWTLTITLPENDPVTTANIAFNASAATIEAAIDAACAGLVVRGVTFSAGDIACTGGAINANPVTLTFSGASVTELNITQCTTTNVSLNDATPPVSSTTTPGVATVDEVQSLAAISSSSGNWTLTITFPGESPSTTGSIAFNASSATIQTAVDTALNGVGTYVAGDIVVAGGAINANPVTLTFSGTSVAGQPIAQSTTADVDLNDATPPVASTTTQGVAPVNEVGSLAAIAAISGNWTLTLTVPGESAETTGSLAFNASSATIQTAVDTALNGVGTYSAGDIVVAGGPINTTAVTLTYSGASVAGANITQATTANVDLATTEAAPVASTTTPGVIDNELKLASSGTATYPNVWDRTTPKRDASDAREPVWDDWRTMVTQIAALESRVLPLALVEDVGIATVDPLEAGGLYSDGVIVALSIGGTNDAESWDGTSRTREVYPAAKYAPDGWDWLKAYQRIRSMQRMLVPLGFDVDGRVPTSDPAVAGQLWTSSGVLTVSAGA
jgi:hypothetical protein